MGTRNKAIIWKVKIRLPEQFKIILENLVSSSRKSYNKRQRRSISDNKKNTRETDIF